MIDSINKSKVTQFVLEQVEKELSGELFPKKVELWQHIKSNPDRLQLLTNYSIEEYLKLYRTCATVAAKDSELFLQWLDVVRSLTCDENKTDKTRAILEEVCGSSFNETQQSVVAIVLNSIHNGLRQQMAGEVEQMSQSYYDGQDIDRI